VNCECVGVSGSAPSRHYDKVNALTKYSRTYEICRDLDCDLNVIGEHKYSIEGGRDFSFTVEVIDPCSDYLGWIKKVFDLSALKSAITGSDGCPKVDLLVYPITEGTYLIFYYLISLLLCPTNNMVADSQYLSFAEQWICIRVELNCHCTT